jgi:diguanylate cyclase (GGDEF)-like protein
MQSKLAIAVILWGWLLFAAWLAYDYVEYGNRMFIHIFQRAPHYEEAVFYVLIILVPFIYTVLGYVINERLKLLKRLEETEKYRDLAFVDGLTNLINRRGFTLLAEQQLKIAERKKQGMVLVYVDVDELKQMNDSLGHNAGDMALIDVTNIIKGTFRKSDIIARIGGDEFVILALDTSWAVSEILVIRLQENLQSHNATMTRPYKLSCSIGFAYYDPDHPCSLEELITTADKYMYEVKQGRQIQDILGID